MRQSFRAYSQMNRSVVIDERYCGFPRMALGGYFGGAVSKTIGDSVEVRLLKPVRAGVRLDIEQADPERAVVRDGEDSVAEAKPWTLDVAAPAAVPVAEAQTASRSYAGFARHLFPGCFCCGPTRKEGDGLRIFPGLIPERNAVAATWTPHASLAGADGRVSTEAVWSALDCPGIWALIVTTPADSPTCVVTGTLAVELRTPLKPGETYVVQGWPLGVDGRKLYAGAAVMSGDGEVHALAKQTCISTGRGIPLGRNAWQELRA